MPHVTKPPPPNTKLGLLAIVVMLLCLLVLMQSCSHKVSVRHYKKVAADIVPFDNEQKKNIIAQKCNAAFPVNEIIKVKDSIVTRTIKVQDNKQIALLKKKLAEKCKENIDLDSFLFANMITDTIYIDHYKEVESKKKDTTGNYFRQLDCDTKINQLKDSFALYYSNFQSCQNDYKELQIENETMVINESKLGYSAKLFFGNLWDSIKWWLLAIVVLYGIYRLLKLRFTLPF